jgi:hypothetical protein
MLLFALRSTARAALKSTSQRYVALSGSIRKIILDIEVPSGLNIDESFRGAVNLT